MKRVVFALTAALLGTAQAGEFNGAWIGAKLGYNQSVMSGLDKQSASDFGLAGGYNWEAESFLLGVEGFAEQNGKATHNPGLVSYGSRTLGLDGKFGVPMGDWLPYGKIGYARTSGNGGASGVSGSDVHLGAGAEYKLTPSLSVSGEYSVASAKTGARKLSNDNFSIGVKYYFDTSDLPYAPQMAPVARRELPVAPVESPKTVEPVVVKAEPKEVWKTLLEENPVTFSGVNFDVKSARLQPGAMTRLDDVAEFAKLYPDARLQITGHTDYRAGKSKKEYNQKLSVRRAESFRDALIEKGIAADRISVEGVGFDKPVADNKTEEGRAENRRVEIRSMIREEKKVRVAE